MEKLLPLIDKIVLEEENHNLALTKVFHQLIKFFNCDRAWCLYPCDPESDSWSVPIESTRQRWPGVGDSELIMPTVEDDIASFNIFLNAKSPVTFGQNAEHPLPDHVSEVFRVKSQIASVIYPKEGKPWLLGMHFCEKDHEFSNDEIEFFDRLGKKISLVLDKLVF